MITNHDDAVANICTKITEVNLSVCKISSDDWKEIFMKQSVNKMQIN